MTQQPWGQPPAPQQNGGWGAPPAFAQPPAQPQQPMWPGTNPNQQQYPPQAPQAPAAAPVSGDEFDDFFAGGVKGEPGFDWGATHNAGKPMIGAQVMGTIVEMVKGQQTDFATRQPLFFQDGAPRMQVAITLQTDLRNWEGIKPDQIPVDPATGQPKHPSQDTGLRRIFVKADMKRAVTEACNRVGQKPRKGGKLAVRVSGFEDTGKGNPMTKYDAAYQPAPEDGGTGGFFEQAPSSQPTPTLSAGQQAFQAAQQAVQQAPSAQQQGFAEQVAPGQPAPSYAQAPAAPSYGQLPPQGETPAYPPAQAPAPAYEAPGFPPAPAAPQYDTPPY